MLPVRATPDEYSNPRWISNTRWLLNGELYRATHQEPNRNLELHTTNSAVRVSQSMSARDLGISGTFVGHDHDFRNIQPHERVRLICSMGYWDLTIDRVTGLGVVFEEINLFDNPFSLSWLSFIQACPNFGTDRRYTLAEDTAILASMSLYGIYTQYQLREPTAFKDVWAKADPAPVAVLSVWDRLSSSEDK